MTSPTSPTSTTSTPHAPHTNHAALLGSPDYETLRQRAHNLRWASVEEGVIPLTAADPDLPAPRAITDAIANYCARPHFCYGPAAGLIEFRESVARHFARTKDARIDTERVSACNSAASAITLVARHLIRAGDEVVAQDPVDFLVTESVRRAGGNLRLWKHDNGHFTLDGLRAALTPRTRALCVCHPHNPMGSLWTPAQVREIAELCSARGIEIISDEVWSDIVHDGNAFASFASFGATAASPWVIYGLSKGFALAGLRIGAVIAPSSARAADFRAHAGFDHTIEGASTLSQVAATAALTQCDEWHDAFLTHLGAQRTHAASRLTSLKGIELARLPEATFVIFPRISATGIDEVELATRIAQHARVRVVPGSPRWFGEGARGHIRLSLACTRATLDEALDRMTAAWSVITAS